MCLQTASLLLLACRSLCCVALPMYLHPDILHELIFYRKRWYATEANPVLTTETAIFSVALKIYCTFISSEAMN